MIHARVGGGGGGREVGGWWRARPRTSGGGGEHAPPRAGLCERHTCCLRRPVCPNRIHGVGGCSAPTSPTALETHTLAATYTR